ncbi:hypothetical protein A2876_01380 [Candidatus Amesbacteria bacterium RIFCSPHIGHO2_01_FULL_48_32b]|uniref:Peptidase C39-like domain-containing protein n=1 Tax=Candidatus Amesbacteria bacterium RIFCSPHIGHO2_01_FULL_48_32b TaxID=1797253 RepID=A0A1F4YCX4_9BACT|nr:MAG: hypothetical protein A2876_01380 [Candidatus Amesbacteria bacterium RIFCSPHIGHO2_01_FULL_48_32b]
MKWLMVILSLIFNFQFTNNSPIQKFPNPAPTISPTLTPKPKEFVLLDVPFTSQAPFGEWSDPRHQDGCEETAALMAATWAGKASMESKADNARKIEDIWEYQVETYGEARDTSAADTAERIIEGYFGYRAYSLKLLADSEDIKEELAKGSVVIVPTDGRGLNPNYTAPGPERHMIVIRGYDDETGEFITNDPGTRKGEKYRYKYERLFEAIRDYPTGYHVPIEGREKRAIVVFSPR